MKRPFLLLTLMGLLLYLPSLFGPFLWDDEDFVYANKYVENFQFDKFFTDSQTAGRGKLSNYYRPIPQIVYATAHAVFGFNPFWYHLINVLAHISAACAVFSFFRILLNRKGASESDLPRATGYPEGGSVSTDKAGELVAFFISLFFLVHPVQTEAVSYISGLSDPLYVLFGFLSLIYFLKGKLPQSLAFFSLSLLSKETGIVFLGLLFLLNYRKIIPYVAIAVSYLWFHLSVINKLDMATLWGNNIYSQSVIVRLLTFVQNMYTYLGLLIFPKDLFMERDYSISIQTSFFHWSLIVFVVLFPLVLYLIRKSKLLVFCYLGFFITFLPYTGIVLINGLFYEHFLYLPLVFFFAFWFVLLKKYLQKRLILYLILLYLLLLGARTVVREFDWANAIRFYSQTLSHAPKSIRIVNGLGMAFADKGDFGQAIQTYSQGIVLDPGIPNLYHNLANVYLATGDVKSAEENYLKAIEIDPKFIFSWQSLASLYQQSGQDQKLNDLIAKFKMIK